MMGICYDLYNAPDDKPILHYWDKDYSLPIDLPEIVKSKLEALYPRIIKWDFSKSSNASSYTACHSTLGSNNCNAKEEYIEIYLFEHSDGYIHSIRISRGSPKLVGTIQNAFGIKYVFEAESCQLLDPSKYTGNWVPVDNLP